MLRCARVAKQYVQSRNDIVGECETFKEERDVLEEKLREVDEYDMEEFNKLDSSERTIAILGERWWPQAAKQEREKTRRRRDRILPIFNIIPPSSQNISLDSFFDLTASFFPPPPNISPSSLRSEGRGEDREIIFL